MRPRVLVAGVGNLFLGDDGFGPEVVQRLVGGDVPLPARVVDYGIRGMHLAYDLLEGYDVLVLVDAVPFGGRPGELRVLEVTADDVAAAGARGPGGLDAHGMDPVAVLSGLQALGGRLPSTLVVGCQPAAIEEGIGLSPEVTAAVEVAVTRVRALVGELVGELAAAVGEVS